MIYLQNLPWGNRDASYASIQSSLKRNQQLNRVALLLAPPPSPLLQRQQQQYHATNMMLKISHMAITKYATVPNNAGMSAIFKLAVPSPTGTAGKANQTTSYCCHCYFCYGYVTNAASPPTGTGTTTVASATASAATNHFPSKARRQ
jgi:hypothetical protein